jgi:hypothetical protein
VQATSAQSDQSGQAHEYLAPSIESAERQLGILLRRMRSYTCAPYAFEESRIRDAADFEGSVSFRAFTLVTWQAVELG